MCKSRPRLRMEIPIRVRDLRIKSLVTTSLHFASLLNPPLPQQASKQTNKPKEPCTLTVSGLIFPSPPSSPTCTPFVYSVSIIPSIMICATWIPCGPNSRAIDCARARCADFPAAKGASLADPLREAVAPVKRRVGGYIGLLEEVVAVAVAVAVAWRRGRTPWAKWKAP